MKANTATYERDGITANGRPSPETNIEISEKHAQAVADILNTVLADEYVLYTKTRNAHWNIQGSNFIALHKFFQEQYEALDTIIDDTAERVRSLGHFALGSLRDFLNATQLDEDDRNFGNQRSITQALLDDHETIIRVLRNHIPLVSDKYRDLGTADFITGIMEQHEKMAWMLRAHLS